MSGDSTCLLVVGILEGRHFPKLKNSDDVYVEAKFGTKSLSTDPVTAQGKPSFNCELGFELLRKDLQLHRLQRTPVKLQLFIRGPSSTGLMSPLGQIVLDLKQAKESPAEPVWFPVLHCKHRGSRPEILISFYLETPKRAVTQLTPTKQEPVSIRQADQRSSNVGPQSGSSDSRSESPSLRPRVNIPASEDAAVPDVRPSAEEPQLTLNTNGDYYIFNRDGDVGRIFRLTVTLVFAERLDKLTDGSSAGPYCFMYYLLGNKVCSEHFQLLDKPDFPAERATVRIKALRATLNSFVTKLDHLDVFLTSAADDTPTDVIGKTTVSLASLLTNGVAEGIYPIGDRFQDTPLQDAPCVGLSATLQLEETDNRVSSSDSVSRKTLPSERDAGGENVISESNSRSKSTGAANNSSNSKGDPKLTSRSSSGSSLREITVSNKSVRSGSAGVSETDRNRTVEPPANEETQKAKENSEKRETKSGKNGTESALVHADNGQLIRDREKKETERKTVKNDRVPSSAYDTVGKISDAVPTLVDVLTHFCLSVDLRTIKFLIHQPFSVCSVRYNYPFVGATADTSTFPTDLQKKIIPEGQNTFCFVTSFSRLREAFAKLPLTLELVSENANVGLAHVYMEPLLKAPTSFFSHSEHVKGHRSTYACDVTFMNRETPAVAEISVFLSLDRLDGKAGANCVTRLQPSFNQIGSGIPDHFSGSKHLRQPTQDELRVALELEVWREQQEELFRTHLKKREEAHLSALAQEWKERDTERENLLKIRINECLRLEEKLRQALSDVDIRETKIHRKEEWLKQQEATFKRNMEDYDRKTKERSAETIHRLEKQNNDTERVQQAQISALERELKQSQEEVQRALSSKSKYKRMWASTLKELVTARSLNAGPPPAPQVSRFAPQSTSRLETEPKTTINEQRALLEREKFELKNIQEEVRRLKDDSLLNDDSTHSLETTSQGNVSRVDSEYLQGLIEERQMLLRTGSYTTDSRVIQQLDRHIRIARNSL